MSYDRNSFLQGIAVGKSLKGWSSGKGTAVPTCWNDVGHYDYFYIDYHLSLAGVTKGLFNLSTSVMSERGELEVTAVEQINATTLRVYCDMTNIFPGWVAVIGYNSSWLTYTSGVQVPEFGAAFWLDGQIPFNFGYLEDAFRLIPDFGSPSETLSMTVPGDLRYSYEDSLTMVTPGISLAESLDVRYS